MADIDHKSKLMTISHMNKEHSSDLGLYLRFVNGLSAEELAAEGHPQMVDMDLESMTIQTGTSHKVHVVPLNPPLASWGERRQRLISLAIEARKAYGVPLPDHGAPPLSASKQPVPFVRPHGFGIVAISGIVWFAYVAFLVLTGRDETIAQAWSRMMGAVGVTAANSTFGGVSGFRALVRYMVLPVLAIHVGEVWWLDQTRLAPHGMKRFSRDWNLWMWSTLWEGFTGFKRFDRLARKAAKESSAGAAAAKH